MNHIKYYQKEYEARRISRREFAGRLGAAGVAATAATSLLTASDSVLADTPVKGGRMRIGWYTHSANDTLNPKPAHHLARLHAGVPDLQPDRALLDQAHGGAGPRGGVETPPTT